MNHKKNALDVRISYTGDNGNTVYTQYAYTQDEDNNIIVLVDGIRKTYSATSITYASLCN